MKTIHLFFHSCFLMLNIGVLPAQSLVHGQIQDRQGQALPFVNVQLLRAADSSLVMGSTTAAETARFVLEAVPPGNYLLSASMIGFKTSYTEGFQVDAAPADIDLGELWLEEDTYALDEVTVRARPPLVIQKMDRLVIHVAGSTLAAGGSVLDVLEDVPGIAIDRRNNTLSMQGKSGLIVLINGKASQLPAPALLQMLAGMSAGQLDKVELITTPGAKLDAAGNAGAVNIIMHASPEEGTNGGFSLALGYGFYEKPGGSFWLNHRRGALRTFADYSLLSDHLWQDAENQRELLADGRRTQTISYSERRAYRLSQNARAGLDWQVGRGTTFGLLLAGFHTNWQMDAYNHLTQQQDQVLNTRIDIENQETNKWRHMLANVNLRHHFGASSTLSIDLDRLYYDNSNPSTYRNQYRFFPELTEMTENLEVSKATPIRLWVVKADFSHAFDDRSSLDVGIKGTTSDLHNEVRVAQVLAGNSIIDSTLSGHHRLEESIAAAYLHYSRQVGRALRLQGGLRWEYSDSDLATEAGERLVRRRYHSFFPSFSISKSVADQNSWQLSYSRRVTRPGYTDMAPFILFMDPFTFFSGNTALRPAFTNVVQAGYQFAGKYLLGVSYSHERDHIVPWQVRVDPETNRQFNYAENIDKLHSYSLSLSAPLTLTNWWQVENHLQLTRQQLSTRFEGVAITFAGQYVHLRSSHSIQLSEGFSLEVSGFYRSPGLEGFGKVRAGGSVDVGVQKSFGEHGGKLRLSVDDLFWTNYYALRYEQQEAHLQQYFTYRDEARVLRLSYSRNFGNTHLKVADRRTTGSESEQKRVRGN